MYEQRTSHIHRLLKTHLVRNKSWPYSNSMYIRAVTYQTYMHNNLKNTTTEYAGNFIYENGDLKFFNHAEGYVDASDWGNGAPSASEVAKDYVYQFKDHLKT